MSPAPGAARPPELWAGVECTVNRVGDTYLDQLARSGHDTRPEDLDLFAALGVRALRYPILWERSARGPTDFDWSFADERLGRLRALGLRPIVGLVHHGSGPPHVDLLDPAFAAGLAAFAAAFARRYPWVEDYTPINEPLTTARFSGLYGHWYPHAHDGLSFARALCNQCRAVVQAMRAVRAVNPAARLVQTEDICRVFSTPRLAYQADFENQRRWLSLDLLCGRVYPRHPLWRYLRYVGLPARELAFFRDNPCPPDVIGLNYYLTSDRFLDDRLERYPAHLHGGNGRHAYADVEAVRVCQGGIAGHRALLDEAWRRYRRPLAITEVHLGCSREEQLRWLAEAWAAACGARRAGIDVRAVTAWALLGAHGWSCLLTEDRGHYEPGVFDARGPRPRPTALAHMVRNLAAGAEFRHPVLDQPGWWRRPVRLAYPETRPFVHSFARRLPRTPAAVAEPVTPRPLLVTGATGMLGRAFARACEQRGLCHRLLARRELDIADPTSVRTAIEDLRPWAVINAAGYSRPDDAEREPERCRRENTLGAEVLAAACAAQGLPLLTFSSELVFDGAQDRPYVESDPVAPLSIYGRSKAEAERRVLSLWPSALIVRAGALFGPFSEERLLVLALRALADQRRCLVPSDMVFSPTYVPDLVHASLDLLLDGETGVWHLANRGAVTWASLVRQAAALAGYETHLLEECAEPPASGAARPAYAALGSERGHLLPALSESLARYVREGAPRWACAGAA